LSDNARDDGIVAVSKLLKIKRGGQLSSVVEQRFCKPSVVGSNPTAGSSPKRRRTKRTFHFLFLGIFSSALGTAETFHGLGFLPGSSSSEARAVSADGLVVVGFSEFGTNSQAFAWSAVGQEMRGLGFFTNALAPVSQALGVSSNGTIVVGTGYSAEGLDAFRWSEPSGLEDLGDFPEGSLERIAYDVSADGTVIVGVVRRGSGSEAFRWTSETGPQGLGDLAGGLFASVAHAVSADGNIITGSASGPFLLAEAFRWDPTEGMIGLGNLPTGSDSFGVAITSNGRVIAGSSPRSREAFRWTADGGMMSLGTEPESKLTSARSISGDGSIIVGMGIGDDNQPRIALIWTGQTGPRPLKTYLEEKGLATSLAGWDLLAAHGISDDGNIIVGFGLNPSGGKEAFIASLRTQIILESTSALSSPFAADSSANIDQATRAIRVPITGDRRFLRLNASMPLRITSIRSTAAELHLTYSENQP
jgi:probable HAF family extracellular repeat protein